MTVSEAESVELLAPPTRLIWSEMTELKTMSTTTVIAHVRTKHMFWHHCRDWRAIFFLTNAPRREHQRQPYVSISSVGVTAPYTAAQARRQIDLKGLHTTPASMDLLLKVVASTSVEWAANAAGHTAKKDTAAFSSMAARDNSSWLSGNNWVELSSAGSPSEPRDGTALLN